MVFDIILGKWRISNEPTRRLGNNQYATLGLSDDTEDWFEDIEKARELRTVAIDEGFGAKDVKIFEETRTITH